MKSLAWYLNRLSKMPPPEILYRVGHKFAEKHDKVRFRNAGPVCPYSSSRGISPQLFDPQTVSPEEAAKDSGRLVMDLIVMADTMLANRIDVFGIFHDFGSTIDWHLDVKTGRRWPLRFWAEVNIRDGFTVGGPKFVWETNRLYGLHFLGLAYWLTKQENYAAKLFALLADWLEANPYPLGVNWTSGIELGTRVANLVWGLSLLAGRSFSRQETELVNFVAWLHGRHLYRYPSKYSSNNNHAIAEAFGLFLIGVYFPGLPEAKKWLAYGKAVLEREIERQILEDGGSYEYSTTYLSFVFDFFLLFKIVCDRNKISYPPIVDRRLEQSCEYISAVIDENGNFPNIGDQDSAVLVNFGLTNHENFKSILNTGCVLFNRPEFCRDNFPDFKTVLLLGDRIKSKNISVAKHDSNKTILLEKSGLGVIRGEICGKGFVFVGNATQLGMPPLYAHGHLDALSFTLSISGLEIFVDPGTYLYHSGGKWRHYFRSTAAHNTVRINRADFTEQVADFMYGKPYRITEHSLLEKDGKMTWRAGHDAYRKLKVPVTHIRQIECEPGSGRFEIVDFLGSAGSYSAEHFFHFHPECSVLVAGSTAIIERGPVKVTMSYDQRLRAELFRGSQEPLLGWYSKAFNHIEESNTLVLAGELAGNVELRTTLSIRCQR